MRKKTQESIRLEWIAAMAHLASEARHEVLDAVIDYLTDGTVADLPHEEAAAQPETPIPGYLPALPSPTLKSVQPAARSSATLTSRFLEYVWKTMRFRNTL